MCASGVGCRFAHVQLFTENVISFVHIYFLFHTSWCMLCFLVLILPKLTKYCCEFIEGGEQITVTCTISQLLTHEPIQILFRI